MPRAGYPRVTHPFAAPYPGQAPGRSLDLHVLSAPPAFVLSQDQTLREGTWSPAEAGASLERVDLSNPQKGTTGSSVPKDRGLDVNARC